ITVNSAFFYVWRYWYLRALCSQALPPWRIPAPTATVIGPTIIVTVIPTAPTRSTDTARGGTRSADVPPLTGIVPAGITGSRISSL
ncbi:MAG TPA: hypothetical protein PKL76_21620, partial [Phycisphaerae bacterium]|nr:hypothetical protein [Phycisphaerae bacterium]